MAILDLPQVGAPTEQNARVRNALREQQRTDVQAERTALDGHRRCEAILICRVDDLAGKQCDAKATYRFGSHAVCWVHMQACTGPRAKSGPPVEFVKGGAK